MISSIFLEHTFKNLKRKKLYFNKKTYNSFYKWTRLIQFICWYVLKLYLNVLSVCAGEMSHYWSCLLEPLRHTNFSAPPNTTLYVSSFSLLKTLNARHIFKNTNTTDLFITTIFWNKIDWWLPETIKIWMSWFPFNFIFYQLLLREWLICWAFILFLKIPNQDLKLKDDMKI